MVYSDFRRLCLDAADCKDFDVFVAKCVDCADVQALVPSLKYIWDFSRTPTASTVRKLSGLTQAAFSAEYGIPRRTVENWDMGVRTPPDYLISALAYAVYTAKDTDR